jgi:hypothetical protein
MRFFLIGKNRHYLENECEVNAKDFFIESHLCSFGIYIKKMAYGINGEKITYFSKYCLKWFIEDIIIQMLLKRAPKISRCNLFCQYLSTEACRLRYFDNLKSVLPCFVWHYRKIETCMLVFYATQVEPYGPETVGSVEFRWFCGSSIPVGNFSDFFRLFPAEILPESTGNCQESTGILLPCSNDLRCFPAGYVDFPASFLQDPAGFSGRNLRPGKFTQSISITKQRKQY